MEIDNRRNNKKYVGRIGEGVACRFLENKGFSVIGRNYLKKWGEIDIIAKKDGVIRFVEVKSVSREMPGSDVAHETRKDSYRPKTNSEFVRSNSPKDCFRPEDNMHPNKIKRLRRIIQTYLGKVSGETPWQVDVVTVLIDSDKKKAKIDLLEDVVL